jgi:hypothetical protein
MTNTLSVTPDVSIVASPNPFSEKVNIKFGDLTENEIGISVFNLNGNRIYFSDEKMINETVEINLSNFPSGMYFVRLEIGGQLYSTKILKK